MSTVELFTAGVIFALLVTAVLLGALYLGRRMRAGRNVQPDSGRTDGSWYFVRFLPGGEADGE